MEVNKIRSNHLQKRKKSVLTLLAEVIFFLVKIEINAN